ncbi:MAG: hypothetical protein LBG74_02355, partial [Spirochaetaceae bacterium]|nr:hypothetical protein [Spirochaetaceae bacterium]
MKNADNSEKSIFQMGISSFRDIKQDVAPNAARHRQPFVHRDTGGQMMPAKPRVFSSWMFALVLLSAAALAAISISSALFGIPPGSNFLGELLADSYGAIAFAIPVYLLFAAYILADKSFKPARIFVLNCVIFPFITLAIGFSYLREFEEFEQKIPLLQFLGKNGFGFLMIFLTVMECIVIAAFTAWLFPPVVARKPLNGPDIRPRPQPNTEARIVPIPIQTENTPVKPLSEPALPENPRDSLFYEVKKSDPLTPQGKAALEDAYEKAQAELEKMNIKKLDVALENLNEKLSFVDELDTNRELREKKNDVPVLKLAVQEDEEIFTGFDDDTLEEIDSFGEEELECGTTSAEHDIEKLISRAENEAAQKTNEFIRKKDGATGAPAAAVPANTSYDKPRQNIMAEKKKSPRIERYAVPVDGILSDYEDDQYWLIDDTTKKAALVLKETLNEFNIQAEVTGIRKGPVITMFEILPSPGVKLSKIVNLQDNIALRLAASPVRIVAPIPGKHAVG